MQMEFFDTLERQLAEVCSPSIIRQIESTHDASTLWDAMTQSGFVDLLTAEESGGAGLGWNEAWQVLFAAGRHAICVPFGQTLYGRAVLAQLKQEVDPQKSLAISGFGRISENGELIAHGVGQATLAHSLLIQAQENVYLVDLEQCVLEPIGGAGCFDANVVVPNPQSIGTLPPGSLAQGLALILAVQISGLADRVLEMTLSYANERKQFGKAIGRFQAVQQQITEMAERVYVIRMASQMACQSTQLQPQPLLAALGKSQASASAERIASIAHAVHGAIGVTREYDLQIYTRRLYEWARIGGGAQYWAIDVGQAAFASDRGLIDFVREDVFQSAKLDLPAV